MSTINKIQAARIAARRAGTTTTEKPIIKGFLNKLATIESNVKSGFSTYLDKRVELSDKRFHEGCRFATEFKAPVVEAPVVEGAGDMSFVNLCL